MYYVNYKFIVAVPYWAEEILFNTSFLRAFFLKL